MKSFFFYLNPRFSRRADPVIWNFNVNIKSLKHSSLLVEFRDSHEGRNSGFIIWYAIKLAFFYV